ncbi:MAG: carboxypeptidase regulatory-like domain-containing protein, partial [Acidobacteriaceae bacterium]|nr:carboxypeptidase regulatory-like domain-containing protein [Acidobacteriaceae bacterium]
MPRLMSYVYRFLTIATISSLPAFAQGVGEITGTVSDPSGAAIVGATVVVINTGTSAERTVKTNDSGIYDFPALLPGNYIMRAEAPGFRKEERKDIVLQVEDVSRIDFAMQIG